VRCPLDEKRVSKRQGEDCFSGRHGCWLAQAGAARVSNTAVVGNGILGRPG